MKEIWQDIKGYEGLYQVSSLGRVKSLPRSSKTFPNRITPERILNQVLSRPNGYNQVGLYKNGKGRMKYVHKLVAKHFIPNDEGKQTVNHKDGNKDNNTVFNLEWASYSEQNYHKFRVLGYKHSDKVKDTFSKNNMRSVNQINPKSNKVIRTWESMKQIQEELGINYMMISKCCRGIRKTTHGFKWEYANKGAGQ